MCLMCLLEEFTYHIVNIKDVARGSSILRLSNLHIT